MEESGVIPPHLVLNQVLQSGGNAGGMGPRTTWKPCEISAAEHRELVDALLTLDVQQARAAHLYVWLKQVTLAPELELCTDHIEWLKEVAKKDRRG